MQIDQMQKRLILGMLISALIIGVASMAVVYKLISVQVLALLSIAAFVVIGIVVFRGRKTGATPKQKPGAVLWLMGPLLLGALVGALGILREGWKPGDAVGAVVCFALLAACVVVYLKRQPQGPVSGPR